MRWCRAVPVASLLVCAACSNSARDNPVDGRRQDASVPMEAATPTDSDDRDRTESGLDAAQNGPDSASDGPDSDASDTGADVPTDAPTEASILDGTSEAAFDASRAEDAGTNYCSTLSFRPTFCADFDNVPSITTGWDKINALAGTPFGTTLAIYNVDSKSPPSSLSVFLPSFTQHRAQKGLEKWFSAVPGLVRFGFDFLIVERDANKRTYLSSLNFGNEPNQWSITFALDPDSACWSEGIGTFTPGTTASDYAYVNHRLPSMPGLTGWTRVEILVDFPGSKLSAWLDNAQVLADEPITPILLKPMRAFVGIDITAPATESRFLTDNVVLDLQ